MASSPGTKIGDAIMFRLFTPNADEEVASTMKVSKILSLYLQEKRLQAQNGTYSAERLAKTEFYARSFCQEFGRKQLCQCHKADFTRWLLEHPEWASSHTKSDAIGTIVSACKWAESEGHIDRNPYRRPRGLWSVPKPREAIQADEVRRILNLARQHNGKRGTRRNPSCEAFRNSVWFMWQTGCRTCEMRGLAWDEIDWENGIARLTKHKTDRMGEDRLIPLSDRVVRFLRWIRRHRARGRWVFPNGRGRQWTKRTFSRMFRKYADLAGVRKNVSAYSIRHGFCVQALENGLGERQIADIMGQASTKYVAWYGRSARKKADYLRKMTSRVHVRKRQDRD